MLLEGFASLSALSAGTALTASASAASASHNVSSLVKRDFGIHGRFYWWNCPHQSAMGTWKPAKATPRAGTTRPARFGGAIRSSPADTSCARHCGLTALTLSQGNTGRTTDWLNPAGCFNDNANQITPEEAEDRDDTVCWKCPPTTLKGPVVRRSVFPFSLLTTYQTKRQLLLAGASYSCERLHRLGLAAQSHRSQLTMFRSESAAVASWTAYMARPKRLLRPTRIIATIPWYVSP
jgi:hypothetical protein